jgi:WD40 repeat protein
MHTFKLFVSSPGDVMVERRRVGNVVSRLNGEFAGVARLEEIRWETEFYQAYSTFQAQIPRSTDCDLVIGILKWRLGTELPPDFAEKLPGSQPFPSGTAYEILTAIDKRQKGGKLPDIYVFRFTGSSPSVAIDDPRRTTIERDWEALNGFLQERFLTAAGHFKAAFNPYTSEDDFEAQLEKLLRKWLADNVAAGRVVRWPLEVKGSPFCGLAAFGAKHAPVFFGRSDDISRAVDLWREAGSCGSPFLLILGASGAGKSSLARAGLLPRLTTPGVIKEVDAWRVAVMRPGDSPAGPFAALAAALMQDVAALPKQEEGRGPALPEIRHGDSRTPAELVAVLRHADAAAVKPIVNALSRVAAGERDRERYGREVVCDLVLLIDQFEELFAASVSEAERTSFIDLVAALLGTGRVWVAVTLRADFYARMLEQPALKKLKELGATYDLAPPGLVELAEIVRDPADAAGLVFETDSATGERLDARLLRDADRPDMLPLVQLALSRLFEGREVVGGETLLPVKVYDRLGGLKGIVNEAGEKALAALGETEKGRLPRLLRQLAVPAHRQDAIVGGALTIRAVPLAQAASDEATHKLVDTLVAARLLTTSGIAADAQVRLAHQRVLEDWSRARAIVAESADFYRIRAELEESRRKWESGKHRSELLLARGLPLAEAESIVGKYGDEFAREILAYVRASRQRARRAQMIGWGVAAAFALIALGASALGVLAYKSQQLAERQKIEAKNQERDAKDQRNRALITESRFLAAAAMQVIEQQKDPATALALALEALPDQHSDDEVTRSRPYSVPAEVSLGSARRLLREEVVLSGHTESVMSVAATLDGSRIVTGSLDGTARVWDAKTGAQLLQLRDASGIESVAVTPDSARIITGGVKGTVRIWDAKTGVELAQLIGHKAQVIGLAVTLDGARIISASNDGTVRIWDASSGAELRQLRGHTEGVSSLAVTLDGTRIVSGSYDKTARIWDAKTGAELVQFKGHTSFITGVAVMPDGKKIVTASSSDKTVRIWDADTGAELRQLNGHTDKVMSVAVTPDGTRIITCGGSILGSNDDTVRIWDAETGAELAALNGHTGMIQAVAVMRGGARIVTGSMDHTARIWSTRIGAELVQLKGHTRVVNRLATTPDGSRIVTGSGDKTVRIWDARTGVGLAELKGRTDDITDFAVTPEGGRIVTGSSDGTVRIWDARTGDALATLDGHTGAISRVLLTPDGARIVTLSADNTVRVWDTGTGAALLQLKAPRLLAVTPDGGGIVTGSDDTTASIWDSRTGVQLAELKGHTGPIWIAAVTPDGSRVVTASGDKTARIWDAKTGIELAVLPNDGHDICCLVVTPDSSRIITVAATVAGANLRKVRIWDARTGVELKGIDDHPGLINRVAVTPDGERIVTAASSVYDSSDDTIRVWDVVSGAQLAEIRGHTGLVAAVMLTPDGTRIISGSADKTARVWDFFSRGQTLIDESKRLAPRCLSPEQRRQFHLAASPPSWCRTDHKWPYDAATVRIEYIGRGNFDLSKRNYAGAIADFTAAIEIDPKSDAAFNGRCWARVAAKADLTQALDDCDTAVRIAPSEANSLDSRGFAYLRLGHADKAATDFDAALKFDPKIPSSLYGRGLAKQANGDSDGATIDIAAARAINSDIVTELAELGFK